MARTRRRAEQRTRRAGVGDERDRSTERDEPGHRAGEAEQMDAGIERGADGEIAVRVEAGDGDLRRDVGGGVRIDAQYRDADADRAGPAGKTAGAAGVIELLACLDVERASVEPGVVVDGGGGPAAEPGPGAGC